MENRVEIIFCSKDRKLAEEIWKGLGAPETEFPEGSRASFMMEGAAEAACIPIVSDQACREKTWKDLVRMVPKEVRLIPVGGVYDVNYDDSDMLPPNVAEVNFIHVNSQTVPAVREALLMERSFYDMKSEVLSNMLAYLTSGRTNTYLMSDRKRIEECHKALSERFQSEYDPFFKQELKNMIAYLELSRKYARRLFIGRILDYTQKIVTVAAAIVVCIVVAKVYPYFKRSFYATSSVAVHADETMDNVHTLRLLEAFTNPFVPESAKGTAFKELVHRLDLHWSNGTISDSHYALRGAALTEDPTSIWVCSEGGHVKKQDLYTREVKVDWKATDGMLYALYVSEKEDYIAVIDDRFRVGFSEGDGSFTFTEDSALPGTYLWYLRRDEESGALFAFGTDGYCYYPDGRDLSHSYTGTCSDILAGMAQDRKGFLICKDGDGLKALVITESGEVLEEKIAADSVSGYGVFCSRGRVLYSDTSGRLYAWDPGTRETEILPLSLEAPLQLALVNDHVLFYHDRNRGSGLFDLDRQIFLGKVLVGMPVMEDVIVNEKMIAAGIKGMYTSQDLEEVLPCQEPPASEVLRTYEGKTAENSAGPLKKAWIQDDSLICLTIAGEEGDWDTGIDGAHRVQIGRAQSDREMADALPDDFAFLSLTDISYSGTAEMIGITEDGRFLLIGTGDGQFIADYIDSQKESVCQDFTVPSHAAVVSVQETEDAFYIHDADGLVWKVPNGRKRITMSGLIGEVKDRYHGDVPEQSAQKEVSPQLLKTLGLQVTW